MSGWVPTALVLFGFGSFAGVPRSGRLAGGFATAALNVGAVLLPTAGGVATAAGLGYRSPPLVSAVLVGVALIGVALLLGVTAWGVARTVAPEAQRPLVGGEVLDRNRLDGVCVSAG